MQCNIKISASAFSVSTPHYIRACNNRLTINFQKLMFILLHIRDLNTKYAMHTRSILSIITYNMLYIYTIITLYHAWLRLTAHGCAWQRFRAVYYIHKCSPCYKIRQIWKVWNQQFENGLPIPKVWVWKDKIWSTGNIWREWKWVW